jgi:hypothetical protein
MSDAPVCDVCGALAYALSSAGEPRTRRFSCKNHRGARPFDGREDNRRFRETMTYDDALHIMRAAEKRQATLGNSDGDRKDGNG